MSAEYIIDNEKDTLRNYEKTCFGCNKTIYFNPAVRKASNTEKMISLEKPWNSTEQELEPYLHTCSKPQNSYQSSSSNNQQWPDQTVDARQKRFDWAGTAATNEDKTESKTQSSLSAVSRIDIDTIKNDIRVIKELLEATIKSFDQILQSQGKGEGLLFTKASNLAPEEKEEEKEIEVKKPITTETLTSDDYSY